MESREPSFYRPTNYRSGTTIIPPPRKIFINFPLSIKGVQLTIFQSYSRPLFSRAEEDYMISLLGFPCSHKFLFTPGSGIFRSTDYLPISSESLPNITVFYNIYSQFQIPFHSDLLKRLRKGVDQNRDSRPSLLPSPLATPHLTKKDDSI